MGSKGKKRVPLPSRPDPPTVEEIMNDVNKAYPNDPIFTVFKDSKQDLSASPDSDTDSVYLQSRRFLELNEQLQEARATLVRQREELQAAGQQLELNVVQVKDGAL